MNKMNKFTTFKRYPKIHRLGKEETAGILIGTVHVEEKIDGANAQIWMSDGKILCGSRNNTLTADVDNPKEGDNMFNGFVEWVAKSEAVRRLFTEHPEMRLYGEWLVRHTIHYSETAYKQFYLFDITIVSDEEVEEFLPKAVVRQVGKMYGFNMPTYHGEFYNPEVDALMEFVGKSTIGPEGEGVVLKNHDFIDAFGNRTYAKIVTENFKENNAVTFGGNNKHAEAYSEMYVVNKYMTLGRVEKIMNKVQPEINEKLDLKHIPRISNSAYYDMLTEEIWEIQSKVQNLNLVTLKRIATKKAIQIYKDILLGSISVADHE
jgi:hypothetical protein